MSEKALDVSLFDVEGIEDMPKVRDMTVGPVSTSDVQEFARRYHYTATGGSMSWNFGLWHGVTLLGVASYNLPTRETCASIFGPDHVDKVWHMGRLALAEHAPRNSESRLIGGTLKKITAAHPGVWCVLTYASVSQGHIGYVYQATNAIYTGTSVRHRHFVDDKGQIRSTKQGQYVRHDDARARGWRVVYEPGKHRYVYILGSKTQRRHRMNLLRLPVLPYPKEIA